jgi:sucrose-6-phosphate hydrolase SacC (GH32 family)
LTTSNDLKTWSSKGKLPINSDTASDTYSRAIQDDKGIYRMIFGSYRPNRTNLWYTSSTDLTNWDEEKELNTAQGYQGWGEAYSPTLLQDSHGKYWVFWESFSNRLYNSSIESGIWFTSSSNFAEWNVPKKGSSPKLGKYEYRLDHH